MEDKHNNPKTPPQGDDKRPKQLWVTLIISLAIVLVFFSLFNAIRNSQYKETTYSDFLEAMESGNLSEVELHTDRIIYMTKEEAEKPKAEQTACFTGLPYGGDSMVLAEKLDAQGVKVYHLLHPLHHHDVRRGVPVHADADQAHRRRRHDGRHGQEQCQGLHGEENRRDL